MDYADITKEAKTIGFNITEFDISENKIKADFIGDDCNCGFLIYDNCEYQSDLYKLAEIFFYERDAILVFAEKDENGEFINEYKLNKDLDKCALDFKNALSKYFFDLIIVNSNDTCLAK